MLHTFTAIPNASALSVWAQGVSNGLAKAGLVRVAGSHALASSGTYAGLASDFSALAAPGTVNTQVAWEIWRFADTLQATFPAYFQIWYGTGSTATFPALWLSGGFALNNDVTPTALAGQVFASQQVHSAAINAVAQNCFVSGGTSRATIGVFFDSAYSMLLSVERLHNPDGTDNDEGLYCFCVGANNTSAQKHQAVSRATFGASGELLGFLAGVWPTTNTTAWGSDFHVAPIHPVRGRLLPPSRSLMAARSADIANGATVTLPLYGANRQWIMAAGPAWQANFASSGSAQYLMRYE
jgi:hypothetical protein